MEADEQAGTGGPLTAGDLPELVPVRMVNEAAYCPRLFYLEWVQARFEDNADTVEGRYRHRSVDRPTGDLPSPGHTEDLRSARSVMLSSERLGLVGKIDLLEGEGDEVVPVDYKRGRAPENTERSWEPERVQLCAQGQILLDNGYRCSKGAIWFAGSRERVEVQFADQLVERMMEVLDELRVIAACDAPPPPLVDSPKCPRCSLVGICLPDEHNALSARSEGPARRLIPTADAARPLYVTEPGALVRSRSGRIEITAAGERIASVRPMDVSQICVFGRVEVTTSALHDAFAREVPVVYMSSGGWLNGIAEGLPSKHVQLRMRQSAVAGQGGGEAPRWFVEGKIRNSRTLLRRNGKPAPTEALDLLATAAASASAATGPASLLGIEGAAARTYFGAFTSMLREGARLPGSQFTFAGRNRRPPRDAVNCLLSFVYAMLVKDLLATCIGVGFDPYIGLYHRPRFGRPALALDLAEEFRPLIGDSTVIQLVNNGEIGASDFIVRGGGVALTPGGRKAVLAAYERRLEVEVTHPVFKYKVSYRRVLEVQSRLLAAWLLGEVPEYVPFVTR